MALIHTKLNRPQVADNYIPRAQLEELLDQCISKPLTLVTAPAGYGKSSLLSHQMERCDHPNAWLSLDESDNDLGLFLNYLIAAVQKMFPESLRETFSLVNAPSLPSASMLSTSLINELAQIEQPFVLVLDDYHLVKEQSVHDLLAKLLQYPPAPMHLVIASRHESPLPFATYRAKGLLAEFGPQDLCFSRQETAAFLIQVFGREVDPAIVSSLHEKTEGWVTGLQLAAISMNHHVETMDLPSSMLKDTKYLKEYFYNEVFTKQPPEIQHSLLSTALLDRFNGPLCEVLVRSDENPDPESVKGSELIAWLMKENLFLIPLDAEDGWYRYHHLFRALLVDLLNQHCDQNKIPLLHNHASEWFADHGFTEEAIQHALAAEDTERAVELVAQAGFQLMDSQEWPRLQRWLRMLPYEKIVQAPELLILKAWICHIEHNLSDLGECLRKLEVLKASGQSEVLARFKKIQGHYEALRGFEFYMASDGEQALSCTRRACDEIPEHHKRANAFAQIFQLGSYQMVGDLQSGLSIYREAMKSPAVMDEGYNYLFMSNLCFVYWIEADLISLLQVAECSLLSEMTTRLPETAAMGSYFLGIGNYYLGDLDRAEENLSRVIRQFYSCHATIYACSSFALALVFQASGKPGKARAVASAVINYGVEANNSFILHFARAFMAELALRQGRLAEASQWAIKFQAKPFLPNYLFYMPQLTQIKVLLAQDTTGSRQAAAGLLDELHAYQVAINSKIFLIDVLALQALLREAQGEHAVALEKLEQAIAQAEPGGLMRPFLDLGSPMQDLFVQLHDQGRHQNYAGQILAAFGGNVFSQRERRSSNYDAPETFLTNRELDILKLAGQRLRDKEIAETVSISLETVKAHMRNIRKKLNVNSRRDAVAKAVDLNILQLG